ncbi:MAG TPA: cytochrome c [Sphingomonas sp.]|nr:cytochrome c [Sphingomonas sp.]
MTGVCRYLPMVLLAILAACSREARTLGPGLPQTPPKGPGDPRIAFYQGNVYQISQGGRYFSWYGCGGCHGETAPGPLKLSDGGWTRGGEFDQVYRSIAGHAAGPRIPTQQLWQITAYVRDLHAHTPAKLRRQNLDEKGEPTGDSWSGSVR